MPEHPPSLYTLYKQGRFREHGAVADSLAQMEQVERFAVAMLGYVLGHDAPFLKKFLEEVCELPGAIADQSAKIKIEITGCGDLGIVDGDQAVYLEFKVKAPLEPHQDPRQEKEFWREGGYGSHIQERRHQNVTFVVVSEWDLV
ncbi:MAG: hypothetical protein ACREP1_03130, partial [Rhodanobacteraceae bacterium]